MFQLFKEFFNLTKDYTYECTGLVYTLPTNNEVVDHTMKEHEAKLFMKKN